MQMNNVNYCNFLFSCLAASCSCFIVKVPWLEKCGRVIWKTCFAVWRVNLVWIKYWHEICRMRWDSFWYGSACFLNGFASFGTSGKSLLWLYASVQLVLFMSETHEQVQLQSQHQCQTVQCSEKLQEPPRAVSKTLQAPVLLNLKLHNSTIRKSVSHLKGFPGESLFSLQRTWQQVCKAAFKQTTRLLHRPRRGCWAVHNTAFGENQKQHTQTLYTNCPTGEWKG